ncbi:tetratricopeptide repeat protein, partial [Streptomyces sp. DT193]|uniref:tetratricopeptide repeat protein n=1 Tax=Streptomyces sp. DT193 TaxID=3393418 RepID=UPI003CF542DE
AEALARQAADHGNTDVLYRLAQMREQAGDQDGAEALARQAADHGNTDVLYRLAQMREQAGDQDGAETLYRQAVDHGNNDGHRREFSEALVRRRMEEALKSVWPYGLNPDGTPTLRWQ